MSHEHEPQENPKWRVKANWVLIGFLAIAAYFLITEHRAHLAGVLSFLPFLLLLACPLMHVFMHGGHGGHHAHGDEGPQDSPPGGPGRDREREQDRAPTHQHHH